MTISPTIPKAKPKRTKAPKWQTGRDSNLEARFQAALVDYVRLVAPQCLVFHIPNGGPGRSLSRLKWLGAISGITDLVIIDEHGLAHFAEVKPPGGQLSDKQRDFRDLCRKMRWPWAQWTHVTDARDSLRKWGISNRDHNKF